jgi:hypothetical protein
MILVALALAAAAVPQSLLDEADAANLAHTQCLFRTMRAAKEADLSPEQFERRLQSNCSAQAQRLRSVSARISEARGEPRSSADQLIEETYRSAVEEYRRLPQIEQQLRIYSAHCKADPKSCS